jgi:hypothetical protein
MAQTPSAFRGIEGDFFVDSSCIDCDTWAIAPGVFREHHDQSIVYEQPTVLRTRLALMALWRVQPSIG